MPESKPEDIFIYESETMRRVAMHLIEMKMKFAVEPHKESEELDGWKLTVAKDGLEAVQERFALYEKFELIKGAKV